MDVSDGLRALQCKDEFLLCSTRYITHHRDHAYGECRGSVYGNEVPDGAHASECGDGLDRYHHHENGNDVRRGNAGAYVQPGRARVHGRGSR